MKLAGARVMIAVTAARSAAFLSGQLAVLREAGADPYLITSPSAEVAAQCAEEGATYIPIEMKREPDPLGDLRAFSKILRALRAVRPALVNAGTPKAGLLVMAAARLINVPVRVQTLHGLRFEAARGPAHAAIWTAQKISCATASHVLCVSPSVRTRAIATGLTSRAHVLGAGTVNGIDINRFSRRPELVAAGATLRERLGIAAGVPVLGYVGRLAHDKGLSELVDAWSQLEATGAHLVVAGELDPTDPPDADVLARLQSAPRTHLLGFVDPAAVYTAIDVLALPTYREGMPTAILEAGALGIPAVSTMVTGCVDAIVDGSTGTLVSPASSDQLADALRRYLQDPALRALHGNAAHARVVSTFACERVQALTIRWYRELLSHLP